MSYEWDFETPVSTRNTPRKRIDLQRIDLKSMDNHLEIWIDQSECGRVIGKGGSMIRELQEKSSANIKICRELCKDNSVPIHISGDDSSKEKAKQLIDTLLQKQNPSNETNQDTDERSELNIYRSDCGKLIGRGGSKIRELQESSNARIKIREDLGTFDTVPVHVFGAKSARQKAVDMIEDLLKEEDQSQKQTSAKQHSNDAEDEFIDWDNVTSMSQELSAAKWADVPDINKCFYQENEEVAAMTERELALWKEKNFSPKVEDISGKNRRILNPIRKFEHAFEQFPEILDTIYNQKFERPSPIQALMWPTLLSGYDTIGIAQTGTGKTLAFLLPAFIHLDQQPIPRSERVGPSVIILTPTRELALQIKKEINKYSYKGIRCCCVYGGGDRRQQIREIKSGVEIVVATPGRFQDLLSNEIIKTRHTTYVVLDEADRMLDMGFEPQIMKIFIDIRPDRQTVMTSATWPSGVRRLANTYLKDPINVTIGSLDLAATHTVEQIIEVVPEEDKRERLMEYLDNLSDTDKVLVFVGKKLTCDDLASDLCLRGIECQSIHGGREQCDREQALHDFATGSVKILVATDVASRGLDVKDVTHVFNLDFPRNMEEYVHRVGRTGRAGKTGTSTSLLTRSDWGSAQELIHILQEAEQEVPMELVDMAERFRKMKEKRAAEGRDFGGRRGGRRGGGRGGGRGRGGGFGRGRGFGRGGRGGGDWRI